MTFREFLASTKPTDLICASFIEEAIADGDLPDVKSWDELEGYLSDRPARDVVIEAAEILWGQYEEAESWRRLRQSRKG